ncbi:MAG: hypothetical protein Sylvanvirus12_12 [Sylvanvirus sp.]|uniref:Cell surface-binding protein OPG105 n=1 Tax=Sylvanvirus sp. TaxID=2487774 RepID=A0A3G5AI78_9VIRU|nr:MAG: hypothetical protein Sylvanvirus12_12 [Sylvanvirus sp.]
MDFLCIQTKDKSFEQKEKKIIYFYQLSMLSYFQHTPCPIDDPVCNKTKNGDHPLIGIIYYQSPIDLRRSDIFFKVHQTLSTHGKNTGAKFNPTTQNYEVGDDVKVLISANGRTYRLDEYHVHVKVGSEHAIEGKKADAELHYVFVQIDDDCPEGKIGKLHFGCSKDSYESKDSKPRICSDICGGHGVASANHLVLARLINFADRPMKDLHTLQVKLPKTSYFEYSGTLTAIPKNNPSHLPNNYAPVLFIVAEHHLKWNRKNFNALNSKTSRPLQPLDGRVLLHSKV